MQPAANDCARRVEFHQGGYCCTYNAIKIIRLACHFDRSVHCVRVAPNLKMKDGKSGYCFSFQLLLSIVQENQRMRFENVSPLVLLAYAWTDLAPGAADRTYAYVDAQRNCGRRRGQRRRAASQGRKEDYVTDRTEKRGDDTFLPHSAVR